MLVSALFFCQGNLQPFDDGVMEFDIEFLGVLSQQTWLEQQLGQSLRPMRSHTSTMLMEAVGLVAEEVWVNRRPSQRQLMPHVAVPGRWPVAAMQFFCPR